MKKILLASSLLIAASFLANCGPHNQENQNVQQQPAEPITNQGTNEMDIITTESGLQYYSTKAGSGESPKKGQKVTVHYTGWLNDKNNPEGWLEEDSIPGKQFDSSVDRKQPFTFIIGVGQVIKGWDEGVASMKPGEKRRLFIPSALGYGARGAAGVIPPNADLIFDVELLKIS